MEVSRTRDIPGLCAFVLLAFGVAALGAAGVAKGFPEWYPALRKPSWTAPDWVFGPVWTLLYALIASAGWLAWREGRSRAGTPLFLSQLALNVAWPWLFFAGQRPALALAVLSALLLLLFVTIAVFWRTSRLAALLLVPYLAWLGYAAALNRAIWALNHG